MAVRLGGFVLHGDDRPNLALPTLRAVCDEVVVHASKPWRGFGAARAEALRKLGPCDYVLYLDSDEWIVDVTKLLHWKESRPSAEFYALWRNDWVDLKLYRREHKRRLIRRDRAQWSDAMLVHESLPRGQKVDLDIAIEHDFSFSAEKSRQYALLWALQEAVRGKKAKPVPDAWVRAAHLLRDGIWKGALFRGHWAIAKEVAEYHVWKQRYLRDAERYPEEIAQIKAGKLEEVMKRVRER